MFEDKEVFKRNYCEKAEELFGRPIDRCSRREQYTALVKLICGQAAHIRSTSAHKFMMDDAKEVYYFSMEFLIGRLLKNYLVLFGAEQLVEDSLAELGISLDSLCECESDPGLGNGGLGRLAACFLDSMAFLGINATGMGIRYRFGLFEQKIANGWQTEGPDTWLNDGYPWETKHMDDAVTVTYGGSFERVMRGGRPVFQQIGGTTFKAVPYDVPIVGSGGKVVNTLRLWRAQPEQEDFDLEAFTRGDYSAAVRCRNEAEAISCILYPDDSTPSGKELRLKQEYFFVSAGLKSILKKYHQTHANSPWADFPLHVSIHTNDTHPALVVPELMRLLLDEEGLEWNEAWDIVTRTVSYTNHTVMPEALEKWPQDLYARLLPRVSMITDEIDRRWRENFDRTRTGWEQLLNATAVVGDGQVRMANLSVIGSHSVNGVAALHTEILKTDTLKAFYAISPEKFNNKTNGISHRRFLIESNPGLTRLITDAIGPAWRDDPALLEQLRNLRGDSAFLEGLQRVKRENKVRLAEYIGRKNHIGVDPDSVFDIQVKRIHAYKRQLLNVLKIMDVYNCLKADPSLPIPPHTFIFAGKAAHSYVFAKEIIKLICSIADVVNADPAMEGRLKVVFLENFSVSQAQLIYPAADISEQISTAGKEASGTGNMKFMMNGAVTLGTLDGANVEIRQRAGEDNIRIFGLHADEIYAMRRDNAYHPEELVRSSSRIAGLMDQLVNGFFAGSGFAFHGVYDALCKHGDEYFVLQDLLPYITAWEETGRLWCDKDAWSRTALMNIAGSGYFSSDRTIREYASDIWKV